MRDPKTPIRGAKSSGIDPRIMLMVILAAVVVGLYLASIINPPVVCNPHWGYCFYTH